jgi:TorA maturation chaperone TorD
VDGGRTPEGPRPPLAQVATARALAHGTFGRLVLWPTEARIGKLRAAVPDLRAAYDTCLELPGFHAFGAALALLEGLDDVTALEEEYTELFMAGRNVSCLPLESAHGPREVAGAVATTVAMEYAGAGLGPTNGRAPDHVATEFDFLSSVCAREADAWASETPDHARRWLRSEASFMRAHLLGWLPRLARNVAGVRPDGTYSPVLRAAVTFAAHDAEVVDALLAWEAAA